MHKNEVSVSRCFMDMDNSWCHYTVMQIGQQTLQQSNQSMSDSCCCRGNAILGVSQSDGRLELWSCHGYHSTIVAWWSLMVMDLQIFFIGFPSSELTWLGKLVSWDLLYVSSFFLRGGQRVLGRLRTSRLGDIMDFTTGRLVPTKWKTFFFFESMQGSVFGELPIIRKHVDPILEVE